MLLSALTADEKALVLIRMSYPWQAAMACVSHEWNIVVRDRCQRYQAVQRGLAENLAESVYVKRAASRVALDDMWSRSQLIGKEFGKEPYRDSSLPGLHRVLALQLHLFMRDTCTDGPIIVTPCAAVALAEACEWAVSWYHLLFDACGVSASSRTPTQLCNILAAIDDCRRNGGTLPVTDADAAWDDVARRALSYVTHMKGINLSHWASLVKSSIPSLPDVHIGQHNTSFENLTGHSLSTEGSEDHARGNWLLALVFLRQFCDALCTVTAPDLIHGSGGEIALRAPRGHPLRGMKPAIWVRAEGVMLGLHVSPSHVQMQYATDPIAWCQYGELAAECIHASVVRMHSTLTSVSRDQLTPFLDGDNLPGNESSSRAPRLNGTDYWSAVNSYFLLERTGWLITDESVEDEAQMSDSSGFSSDVGEEYDEEEEDALYANFLTSLVGFEDDEDENDVDDPDVADEDDPNDPEYITHES